VRISEAEEEIFNSKIHKSHLLNCSGLREIWSSKVKKIKRIEYEEEKKIEKQFLS